MKKIYFVRHGATENNLANMMQDENTPLSDLGLKQAEFLGQRFDSIDIDQIFSSSMKRAYQTAEAIRKIKDLEIKDTDLLIEILKPSAVRGKSKDDPEVRAILKNIKSNSINPNYRYSDEENFNDLITRAQKVVELIVSSSEKNILLVTHGQFLVFVIGYMLFGPEFTPREFKRMEEFFIAKNTGISIIEMNEDKPLLITWNDHAHLGELDIF